MGAVVGVYVGAGVGVTVGAGVGVSGTGPKEIILINCRSKKKRLLTFCQIDDLPNGTLTKYKLSKLYWQILILLHHLIFIMAHKTSETCHFCNSFLWPMDCDYKCSCGILKVLSI